MIRFAVSLALLLALAASAGAQTATMAEGTPIVPRRDRGPTIAASSRRPSMATSFPPMAALQEATGELGPALGDLCAVPTASTSDRPCAHAFAATIDAWAGVDFLRFGPMAQEGRYERFAFFPDVHGTGARQLRRFLAPQDEALLKPGALAGQSAAVQGLPALESLLFSGNEGAPRRRRRPSRSAARSPRRSPSNMHAIADGSARRAGRATTSWATLIENPGPDNPVYRTHAEAMTEILKAHPDRPRAGARPSPAAGARRNAGGGEGEPRALQSSPARRLPISPASADALQRFVDASGILDLAAARAG